MDLPTPPHMPKVSLALVTHAQFSQATLAEPPVVLSLQEVSLTAHVALTAQVALPDLDTLPFASVLCMKGYPQQILFSRCGQTNAGHSES